MPLIKAGIVEVADLPLVNGTIDYCKLQEISKAQGPTQSVFLLASALQNKFKSFFHFLVSDRDLQLEPIKTILHTGSWKQPTLIKWEVALQILPLSTTDMSLVFKRLMQKIKISKLRDCNFKILHRILATPALISKIRKNPNMVSCIWCRGYAKLDHMLIMCLVTQSIRDDLIIKIEELSSKQWILGQKDMDVNYIISVFNFAICKAHIMGTSGYRGPLQDIVSQTLQCFAPIVRAIRTYDLI